MPLYYRRWGIKNDKRETLLISFRSRYNIYLLLGAEGSCQSIPLFKIFISLFKIGYFSMFTRNSLVFSFELFYIAISWLFIVDYAVWALLIVESLTMTHSCQVLCHLLTCRDLSHCQSYHIFFFIFH